MERFDGLSLDTASQRRQALHRLFPECFVEGELNTEKLLQLCGLPAASSDSCYELRWQGKRDCLPRALQPSRGTLRPDENLSLDLDHTHHVFIEGENLEVLKILQRSYQRRFKMIYIDPPYNTGREFVYDDNYADSLEHYRQVTAQTAKSNAESAGRFHTNYLNMLYPRLRLAANLLRDDGIMFISIDDGEVANLRKLCDEVFGEENFLGQFVWRTKRAARGVPPRTMVMSNHEYIVAYARALENARLRGLPRDEEDFANPDHDPRGLWRSESIRATGSQNNYFTITDEKTGHEFYGNWAFSPESIASMISQGLILFPDNPQGTPRQKKFIDSYLNDTKAITTDLGWHSSENATSNLMQLFDGQKTFDFPKPLDLLMFLVQQSTSADDLILDFFAGSGTLGEAVWRQNASDQGRRRFVLVQLPERCAANHPAYKAGFPTVCAIARERLCRASSQLHQEQPLFNQDCGFRYFRLDTSSFRHWDPTPQPDEDLLHLYGRLHELIDKVKDDRTPQDVATELLLQNGLPLDSAITSIEVEGHTVWRLGPQVLLCLQSGWTEDSIEKLLALKPQTIISAEECFPDSATLSNVSFLLQQHTVEFRLV